MRRRMLLLAIPLLFLASSPSSADPYQIETGDAPREGGAHLPVGYGYTSEQLEAAARALPGVDVAMQVFQDRGYVSVANADTGLSMVNGYPVSLVVLYYYKPGLFMGDSAQLAVPIITVVTRRVDADNYTTEISSGAIHFNANTEQIGDAGAASPTDYSFSLARSSGGGGGKQYTTNSGIWEEINDPNSTFNHYVRCLGWGAVGCMATAWSIGGPNFQPIKIATLMAQPELGLVIIAGCALGAVFGCLGSM